MQLWSVKTAVGRRESCLRLTVAPSPEAEFLGGGDCAPRERAV